MFETTGSKLPQEVALRFVPVIRRAALRIARRVPSHVCLDDLMSAGYLGLVDAHRRYDASRCDRFEPYAELRIKGAMLDELRSSYDRLSRDLRDLATRTSAVTRRLETTLGRRATESEIAAALDMSLEEYRAQTARIAMGTTVSLDADDSPEVACGRRAADGELADAQTRGRLGHAVATLPDRLRQVIELYYGDEMTLKEIGGRLGVTESRVC